MTIGAVMSIDVIDVRKIKNVKNAFLFPK